MSRPVVTVVGRPNVGKSSLFNRILGRRKALVQDTPGVTRDRNYAIAELDGREVILCDTGGFEETGIVSGEVMARLIREQALVAIEESDILVHVMDIRDGLTATDEEIVARLRSAAQPVFYVLNKCDHPSVEASSYDFYRLGIERLWLVSAAHGRGFDDLVTAITATLPAEGDELGQVTEQQVDPRELAARRRSRSQRGKRNNPRLQFLGDDMPEEPVTRSGPTPQEWDGGGVAEEGFADGQGGSPGIVLNESGLPVSGFDAQALPEGEWSEDEIPEDLADFEVIEADDFVPRMWHKIVARENE